MAQSIPPNTSPKLPMKTIFKMMRGGCIVAALGLTAVAQEAPKNGFIRLANGVGPGVGLLTMEVEGKSVNDTGYKVGDVTGGISLPPGNCTVRFSREGIKEGMTRVNVLPNETTTLIPFAEMVPATDEVPAHWEMRILKLKQKDPQEERTATFVSVSKRPEIKVEMRDPEGNWTSIYVKRLATSQAPILYPRGYVPLKTAEGDLVSIPISSPGTYVVLLYDDGEGKVQSLNFRDRKFLSAD